MAEIIFLTGLEDKTAYAVRLLRKKLREGGRVAVYGPAPLLTRLDRALWDEPALDFLPHLRLRRGDAAPDDAALTPIWLLDAPEPQLCCDAAVNLGTDDIEALCSHDKVAELVSVGDDDRVAGQQRWKRYKALGHALTHRPQGETRNDE